MLGLFSFIFSAWLTGNHPLESRGKHFKKYIREVNILLYEIKKGEMYMKIYIVKNVFIYDGCVDDYYNCYKENIEKIFDCEEKAIRYIQDKIKDMLDLKLKILEAKEKVNKEECCREKCLNCIACDDYISLDVIPTTDEIKETHEVEYDEERKKISKYIYETYEVE